MSLESVCHELDTSFLYKLISLIKRELVVTNNSFKKLYPIWVLEGYVLGGKFVLD
jgi:hypothetical protein